MRECLFSEAVYLSALRMSLLYNLPFQRIHQTLRRAKRYGSSASEQNNRIIVTRCERVASVLLMKNNYSQTAGFYERVELVIVVYDGIKCNAE